MSNNLKRGGNAIFYSVLTIGIVIFINVISSRFFARVDLTEDQIYTLSDASKKLVAALPDRMTIKAFISGELPPHPQLKAIERYTRDMLDEYAAHSNGKVVWEALDPDTDEKAKEEAKRLKIFPTNLAVYGATKSSVAQAYLGIAFQYGGKVEAIPFVTSLNDLEYQISSTIRRLTTDKKKLGFSTGHGEPTTAQGLASAGQRLKDYEVTSVDLTEGKKPIPDDIDVLVIVAPSKPFAERAKYEIDQFLMKGKAVALFLDGMVLETPRGQFGGQTPPRIARANNVGLTEQLEYYGVLMHDDIIMDRQNQRVQLPAGRGQAVVTNYPAFPVVTTLDQQSPITRKVKAYVSIFPSSVELTKEAREGKGGLKSSVLASSSSASWRQTGFFLFDPLRQPEPTKDLGPFSLAVSLSGPIKSYFAGRPVPAPGPATGPTENKPQPSGDKRAPAGARLVVFGDGDMIKDQFLGLSQGQNLHLLLNTVDYLAQDLTLVAIRSKGQTRRPLENVEDGTVLLAKVGNIAGLPLAFILFGIIRWRFHRARRARRARDMAQLKD